MAIKVVSELLVGVLDGTALSYQNLGKMSTFKILGLTGRPWVYIAWGHFLPIFNFQMDLLFKGKLGGQCLGSRFVQIRCHGFYLFVRLTVSR